MIGAGAAARLGIRSLESQPAVFVGDEAFLVIGIVADVQREADLLLSVVVPHTTATQIWGAPRGNAKMLISTDLGAATQVASEAPMAISPNHPDYFKAVPPPTPGRCAPRSARTWTSSSSCCR